MDSLYVNEDYIAFSSTMQTMLIYLDSNLQFLDAQVLQTDGSLDIRSLDADTSILVFAEFTGLMVVGSDTFQANPIYSDLILIEISKNRSFQQIIQMGGVYENKGAQVTIVDSLVVVSGTFEGTIQVFDSTLSTATLQESGFVVCLKRNEGVCWMRRISSDQQVFINNHLVNQDRLIVAGYFSGQIEDGQMDSHGAYDALVASYDLHNGSFLGIQTWGDTGNDQANHIELVAVQIYMQQGHFKDTWINLPSVSASGFSDGIFTRLLPQTVAVHSFDIVKRFDIYPNPNRGVFQIEESSKNDTWSIFDRSGQLLLFGVGTEKFDVDLPNGHYWLHFYSDDQINMMPLQIMHD